MTTKREIDEFLAQKTLAIVGVSRSGKKFGNTILKDLPKLGYRLMPIHPEAAEVGGVRTFPSLAALPEPVGGVIVCVPPDRADGVVKEAAAQGIRRVWLQQGAESDEAITFCRENGISVVHGECVLMYPKPTSSWVHGAHRWVWDLIGRTPK
jgi:predicted CoA-binding protein